MFKIIISFSLLAASLIQPYASAGTIALGSGRRDAMKGRITLGSGKKGTVTLGSGKKGTITLGSGKTDESDTQDSDSAFAYSQYFQ